MPVAVTKPVSIVSCNRAVSARQCLGRLQGPRSAGRRWRRYRRHRAQSHDRRCWRQYTIPRLRRAHQCLPRESLGRNRTGTGGIKRRNEAAALVAHEAMIDVVGVNIISSNRTECVHARQVSTLIDTCAGTGGIEGDERARGFRPDTCCACDLPGNP